MTLWFINCSSKKIGRIHLFFSPLWLTASSQKLYNHLWYFYFQIRLQSIHFPPAVPRQSEFMLPLFLFLYFFIFYFYFFAIISWWVTKQPLKWFLHCLPGKLVIRLSYVSKSDVFLKNKRLCYFLAKNPPITCTWNKTQAPHLDHLPR